MSSSTSKPRPVPRIQEELDAEFFSHCARGELRFQRCESCGRWRHLPRHMCASCGSAAWTWEASSGRGRIYSWTVIHQAMHPGFQDDVPYAVVVVEMDEGVRVVSALRGTSPDQLALDLPVVVGFEAISEQVALPIFHLD